MNFVNDVADVCWYFESLTDATTTDEEESVVLLFLEVLTLLKDALFLLDDAVFLITKLTMNDLGDLVDCDEESSFFGG